MGRLFTTSNVLGKSAEKYRTARVNHDRFGKMKVISAVKREDLGLFEDILDFHIQSQMLLWLWKLFLTQIRAIFKRNGFFLVDIEFWYAV